MKLVKQRYPKVFRKAYQDKIKLKEIFRSLEGEDTFSGWWVDWYGNPVYNDVVINSLDDVFTSDSLEKVNNVL